MVHTDGVLCYLAVVLDDPQQEHAGSTVSACQFTEHGLMAHMYTSSGVCMYVYVSVVAHALHTKQYSATAHNSSDEPDTDDVHVVTLLRVGVSVGVDLDIEAHTVVLNHDVVSTVVSSDLDQLPPAIDGQVTGVDGGEQVDGVLLVGDGGDHVIGVDDQLGVALTHCNADGAGVVDHVVILLRMVGCY